MAVVIDQVDVGQEAPPARSAPSGSGLKPETLPDELIARELEHAMARSSERAARLYAD
jgi:hypothetical protein